jgi:anti-sigma B factor antagonist
VQCDILPAGNRYRRWLLLNEESGARGRPGSGVDTYERGDPVAVSAQQQSGSRVVEDGGLTMEVGPEVESCLVSLRGELDLECAPTLEAELNRLLSSPLQRVTVDLSALEFIDSTGLRCLIKASRDSKAAGSKLRFLRPAGQVQQVLQLTKLDQALPFVG